MTDQAHPRAGRLSTLAAALVVARRDFSAILFSRSFFFFLIGPLFPLVVGALASGVGDQVRQNASEPILGIAMTAADSAAMRDAAYRLEKPLGSMLPQIVVVPPERRGSESDSAALLQRESAHVNAILSGTPARPVLTGPADLIENWRAPVGLLAAEARGDGPVRIPAVAAKAVAQENGTQRLDRMRTAQGAQTLLFLLTMLLAGMVLSNLVEEKANKIIEVLAAAVPMDAVFLGKLFAMLAVSFVGIAVWGATAGTALAVMGRSLAEFPPPAVGWPMFFVLGIVYFSAGYLLLGSIFLTIGSMAATVREVQTLSMPVTMLQLLIFFFASYTVATPGSPMERLAAVIPFSSPFAMLARAATDPGLLQHALALGWQLVWIAAIIRMGSQLFRRRVMKSGPAVSRRKGRAAKA